MSGPSHAPVDDSPPDSGRRRQKPHVSVILEERMLQDPILARHFENLENPGSPELIQNPFDTLASPHQLRTSHRLVRSTDSSGIKYLNQYIVVKLLGHGSYGKVKLCLNTHDSKLYAIKIVDRKRLIDRRIAGYEQDLNVLEGSMLEIAILKKLNHPNIVALHEVIDDTMHKKLYLVLEYVERGPILQTDHWVAISEEKARRHFRDICRGLDYLHYHKILHRDLKPENLLQTADGRIKISDFGVSRVFEKSDAISFTSGTPAFLAPEVCSQSSYEGRPVDIWALGVCLYVLVFGAIPFPAKSTPEMYHAILHKELRFPSLTRTSKDLRNLLGRILTKESHARITLPGIMEHSWVTTHGLQPLTSLTAGGSLKEASLSISEDELKSAYITKSAGLRMLFDVGVQEQHFEAGDYIIRQGEEGHEMYYINSGKCEVLIESSAIAELGGAKVEYSIATRGPGQFVGEMALFSDPGNGAVARRQASLRAKTPVTVLVINKTRVLEALAKDPSATQSMKEMIRCREQETLNKVNELELGFPQTGDFHHEGKCMCTQFRSDTMPAVAMGVFTSNLGQIGSLNHVKWLGLYTSQTAGVDCNCHVLRQRNHGESHFFFGVQVCVNVSKEHGSWKSDELAERLFVIFGEVPHPCRRSLESRVFNHPAHQHPSTFSEKRTLRRNFSPQQ